MKEQLIKALLKPEITVEDKYKLIEDLNSLQEEKDRIKTILKNIDYFLSDIYKENVFDEVSLDAGDYKEFRSEISRLKEIVSSIKNKIHKLNSTKQEEIDLSKQLANLQSKNQKLIDKNNNLNEDNHKIKSNHLKIESQIKVLEEKIKGISRLYEVERLGLENDLATKNKIIDKFKESEKLTLLNIDEAFNNILSYLDALVININNHFRKIEEPAKKRIIELSKLVSLSEDDYLSDFEEIIKSELRKINRILLTGCDEEIDLKLLNTKAIKEYFSSKIIKDKYIGFYREGKIKNIILFNYLYMWEVKNNFVSGFIEPNIYVDNNFNITKPSSIKVDITNELYELNKRRRTYSKIFDELKKLPLNTIIFHNFIDSYIISISKKIKSYNTAKYEVATDIFNQLKENNIIYEYKLDGLSIFSFLPDLQFKNYSYVEKEIINSEYKDIDNEFEQGYSHLSDDEYFQFQSWTKKYWTISKIKKSIEDEISSLNSLFVNPKYFYNENYDFIRKNDFNGNYRERSEIKNEITKLFNIDKLKLINDKSIIEEIQPSIFEEINVELFSNKQEIDNLFDELDKLDEEIKSSKESDLDDLFEEEELEVENEPKSNKDSDLDDLFDDEEIF